MPLDCEEGKQKTQTQKIWAQKKVEGIFFKFLFHRLGNRKNEVGLLVKIGKLTKYSMMFFTLFFMNLQKEIFQLGGTFKRSKSLYKLKYSHLNSENILGKSYCFYMRLKK